MAYVIAEPCIGTKEAACVKACPVDAIHKDVEMLPQWSDYIAKNKDFFAK